MNVGNIERYRTKGVGWRYRVRWSLPDGQRRSKSFKLRKDADAWLRRVEADRMHGVVHDPRAGRKTFSEYTTRWLNNRPDLAPRTVELYESQLRRHLLPRFGSCALTAITIEQVREWRADVERATSATTAAKCYRLMHAMMRTAEDDGLIPRNPCRVKGASVERTPERPLLTVEQVVDLADAIEPRYRALVLLAAFSGLRRGELLALERRHIDELHNTVRVEAQAQRVKGRGRVVRTTKTEASVRTVAISSAIVSELLEHVYNTCGLGPTDAVFVEACGSPVREGNLYAAWKTAAQQCGLTGVRFHDLRHFAGTEAARVGYTARELQSRLGHSTTRAAMIYQHVAEDRDRELADRTADGFVQIRDRRLTKVTSLDTG